MKKYTNEEKEKISKVKIYLKKIRFINRKLKYLKSLKDENVKQFEMASDGIEDDAIDIQIDIYQKEFDCFVSKTYLLMPEEIQIINIFVNSDGYSEMINNLRNKGIEEYTYCRKIPLICLKLDKLINDADSRCQQRAYNESLKKIKCK